MSVEIQRQRTGVCAAIFADELNDFYGGSPFVEIVTIEDDFDITITYDITPTTQNLTDLDTLLAAHDCTSIDDEGTFAEAMTFDVFNNTGSTIISHTPIYITGFDVTNNVPTAGLADASNPLKMPSIGMVCKDDIPNNTVGLVIYSGPANLVDTSGKNIGDSLYVAPGGGPATTTRPIGTDLVQKIAEVVRVDAINGISQVFGVGRSNDLPNLPTGKAWMGDINSVPQPTDVYTELEVDGLISTSTAGLTRSTFAIWAEEKDNAKVSKNNYEYSFGNDATNNISNPSGIPMGINCTLIAICVSATIDDNDDEDGNATISISVTKNGTVVATGGIASGTTKNIEIKNTTQITPDTVNFVIGDTLQFLTASTSGKVDNIRVVAWFERTS